MPTLRIPAVMNFYTERNTQFDVPGVTAIEVVRAAVEKYPALKFHLMDVKGDLRRHVNVFVNDVHVRDLNGLDTPVGENDVVRLLVSAAGG